MSRDWAFKAAAPGDRARESLVEKFFSSDAVANRANAIVREGIQNSLDAAPDEVTVRVRVKVGAWNSTETQERLPLYESGFREHLEAEGVQAKMPYAPAAGDPFRFLTFEDFGTSGLKGDPAAWWPDEHGESEPFFNYFRAEGISGKTEGSRGRHGVGRLVFMFASRTHCMFGLTRRDGDGVGGEELLMGTAVLRNHRIGKVPYLPDGWFGSPDPEVDGLTLPITDAAFNDDFKKAFDLSRTTENGLSVVVPWLAKDVTASELTRAVLEGYYYPTLAGKLEVSVEDELGNVTTITAATIEEVVESQGEIFAARVKPMVELAKASLALSTPVTLNRHAQTEAPKWHAGIADEERLQQIAALLDTGAIAHVRVPVHVRPRARANADSFFDLYITRDQDTAESQIHFIREGIMISDVRPRRTSGIRAIVVIDEGPLASLLGDSENPSHTQWQKDLVKDRYFYAPGMIDFVSQCVPQLLLLISQSQRKADTSLLLDLFAIPATSGFERKRLEDSEEETKSTKKKTLDIKPGPPRRYRIDKRVGGFVVKGGDVEFSPFSFTVRFAYAIRRGNPLTKYEKDDFELAKGGVTLVAAGCDVSSFGSNWAIVKVSEKDFELSVKGLDTSHRDIFVDVRTLGADSEAEARDATSV